jgi:O-antigen ligase
MVTDVVDGDAFYDGFPVPGATPEFLGADETDALAPIVSAKGRLPRSEWMTIGIAFVLPFAWHPQLYTSYVTLKLCLMVLLLGPGLAALATLLRQGDRAARWAAAYLTAALLSTLVSGQIMISALGDYPWANGLVLSAAIVSAWALGRSLSDDGRRVALTAVVFSASVVSVFALSGSAFDIFRDRFVLGERAHGLLGNPVHLTSFLSAALILAIHRSIQNRRFLISVVLIGSGIEFGGGRIGLIAGVATIIGAFALYRFRSLLPVAVSIVGVVIARLLGGGVAASSRILSSAPDRRPIQWKTTLAAFRERPLIGWGPGRLDVATGPSWTIGSGPCRVDESLADAHNIVLHHLATVGLVGTVLFLSWLVVVGRQTRGPVLVAAMALGVNLMVEPMWGAVMVPIALLLGSVSSARAREMSAPSSRQASLRSIALVMALIPAAALFAGDLLLRTADQDSNPSTAQLAVDLLPNWPAVQDVATRASILTDPQKSLAIARDVSAWDTMDDDTWYRLGNLEARYGSMPAARKAFERALELNPGSLRATFALAKIGTATGDTAMHDRYVQRLKESDAKSCTPDELVNR